MKINTYHIIGLIIYTVLIVLVTYLLTRPQPAGDVGFTNDEQRKMDSLNVRIGELESRQRLSDSLILNYKQDIDLLNYKIDSTKTRVIQIRKHYENRIKDASSYTPSELDRFFSDRYH